MGRKRVFHTLLLTGRTAASKLTLARLIFLLIIVAVLAAPYLVSKEGREHHASSEQPSELSVPLAIEPATPPQSLPSREPNASSLSIQSLPLATAMAGHMEEVVFPQLESERQENLKRYPPWEVVGCGEIYRPDDYAFHVNMMWHDIEASCISLSDILATLERHSEKLSKYMAIDARRYFEAHIELMRSEILAHPERFELVDTRGEIITKRHPDYEVYRQAKVLALARFGHDRSTEAMFPIPPEHLYRGWRVQNHSHHKYQTPDVPELPGFHRLPDMVRELESRRAKGRADELLGDQYMGELFMQVWFGAEYHRIGRLARLESMKSWWTSFFYPSGDGPLIAHPQDKRWDRGDMPDLVWETLLSEEPESPIIVRDGYQETTPNINGIDTNVDNYVRLLREHRLAVNAQRQRKYPGAAAFPTFEREHRSLETLLASTFAALKTRGSPAKRLYPPPTWHWQARAIWGDKL